MNNVDQILQQGRFSVADDGFTDRMMASLDQVEVAPVRMVMRPKRLSAWLSFRLPMIGVAVGILLFGFLVTRIVDMSAWGERYIEKSEMLTKKIASITLLSDNENTKTDKLP